jgi:hypothetical protein
MQLMQRLQRVRAAMRLIGPSLISLALFACETNARGKHSADQAAVDVARLVVLTSNDVGEVERGLPDGAGKLGELLTRGEIPLRPGEPKIRGALLKMRERSMDLGVAKSTFFALANEQGVALRNEFEQDSIAGLDLLAAYPALSSVVKGAPYASATGQLSPSKPPAPPDREWVAAVPVAKVDGTKAGILVTGWTYRRFAYHLQVSIERELRDRYAREGNGKKVPVEYVCLFDHENVYCARMPGAAAVPEVNERTLRDLNLHGRTSAGPTSSPITIEGREFGWAAARAPRLSPDVGLVVLRSDL